MKADVVAAAKGRSKNAEAHQLYLRAQFLVERHTPDDTAKSIEYFRNALEFDPHYALAWAGLAGAYSNQAGFGWAPLAETFERATGGGAARPWIWSPIWPRATPSSVGFE